MKETLKWEGLLNALLGHKFGQVPEISGVRIIGKDIIFKAHPDTYGKLQYALNHPEVLKESISHAMPTNPEEEPQASAATPQVKVFPTLPQNAREVMNALVTSDFQKFAGIDKTGFQDLRPGISSWKLGNAPTGSTLQKSLQAAQLHEQLVKINFLRNALKDMAQLCDVMLGEAPQIGDTDGEALFASEEVIKVQELPNKTEAEIQFNWGRILEEASAHPKMHGSRPVISARTSVDGEYSLNMESLGFFIPEYLGPLLFHQTSAKHGTVFGTKGHNEAGEDVAADIKPTIFHLLIDHSQSLEGTYGEYIERIQASIDSLIANCGDKWEIRITGFGRRADKTETFHSQTYSVESVKVFIKRIKCEGNTALHDAILASLSETEDVNIILYTDGAENGSKVRDQSLVVKKLAEVRDANPDFSMTSIGYGTGYDARFFEKVASANGFHHADIRQLDQLEALESYFLGLNGSKALFEFVHELIQYKLKMQTIEGQVTTTEDVPIGAKVKHGDVEYEFKTEVGAIADERQREWEAKIEAMKAKEIEEKEEFAKIAAQEVEESARTKSAAEDRRADEEDQQAAAEAILEEARIQAEDATQAMAAALLGDGNMDAAEANIQVDATSDSETTHNVPLGETQGTCVLL